MRKLVAAAICLMSLSLSVTTGRRCINEAETWTVLYYFLPGYCYWNKEWKTLWPGTNHARADDKKVVGSLSRLHRAGWEGGCGNVSDQDSIGVLSTMNNILYIQPLINLQGAIIIFK